MLCYSRLGQNNGDNKMKIKFGFLGAFSVLFLMCAVPHGALAGRLLNHIGTNLSFEGKVFYAVDHFRVNTSPNAKVKIASMNKTFINKLALKVEKEIPAGKIRVHTLTRQAEDISIIGELGNRHETYIADFWVLLEHQGNGERGPLLTTENDLWGNNIFYIRGKENELLVVHAQWYSNSHKAGWNLYAYPIEEYVSIPWSAGRRVFSRSNP
jgi:hypothetical protein